MNFKYYKVTTGKFVERVAHIRAERKRILPAMREIVGCAEILMYDGGRIAGFVFPEGAIVCAETFKDARVRNHRAFLPRLGDKKGKKLARALSNLGKVESIKAALDVFNLPSMVLGGPHPRGRGVTMHDSDFVGDLDSGTFFIVVPQETSNPYTPECESMVECKKWEMEKFIEELGE